MAVTRPAFRTRMRSTARKPMYADPFAFTTISAYNIGPGSYYTGTRPFINEFLICSSFFNSSYIDPVTGWPTNMPHNEYAQVIVMTHNRWNVHRTGTYYCTWDDPGLSINFVAATSGTSNIRAISARKAAVDVGIPTPPAESWLPSGDVHLLYLTIRNISGAPITVSRASNIQVYHSDDEADLLAGKMYQQSFIDSINHVTKIRFLDWLGTNLLGAAGSHSGAKYPLMPEDFPQDSWSTWSSLAPASALGRLATECGITSLAVTIPVRTGPEAMLAIAQDINANYSGNVEVSFGNESWNFAPPFGGNLAWLRDVKSTLLASPIVNSAGNVSTADDDKVSCAMADGACQMLSIFTSVMGANRVTMSLEGFQANTSSLKGGFEYASPYHGGVKVKYLATRFNIGGYFYLVAGNGVATADPKTLLEQKAWTQPDSWFRQAFLNGVNSTISQHVAHKVALSAIRRSIRLSMYEGGYHTVFFVSTERYPFTLDTADNTAVFAGNITSAFDDGELISLAYRATQCSTQLNHYTRYKVRRIGTNKLKIYPTQADYDADIPAVMDGPAGTYGCEAIERLLRMSERTHDFLAGPIGLELYQALWNGIQSTTDCFNHFTAVGPRSENAWWGIAENQYGLVPDADRYAWFKTLP